MASRLNIVKAASGAYRAMSQLDHYIKNCGLELSLIELIEIRASQINGCAYCIDMHTKNARAAGRASSASICFLPGEKRHATASGNARGWSGPRRSPSLPIRTFLTRSTNASDLTLRMRN